MGDQLGPRGAAIEGRNGEVWRRYTVYRWTQERIAEHFGLSKQRIQQIIAEVRKALPDTDLAEMRRQSLELYAELTARALEIADLAAAPVFVGKDGSIAYDEEGNVVRDYSGKLRAMETAMKFDAETRKLMGLDAAQRAEIAASVKYEIVGVDPSQLI